MDTAHFRKLEKMYLGANVNTKVFDTTTCNIEAEKATITLDVSEDYYHALGAIHGAVYFKMLDDAAYFAVSSVVKDNFMLTSSFNINILRPVSKGKLTAVGTVRYKSSKLYAAEAKLYNQEGKEVAFGTGNFAKSKLLLSEEVGYK
jgi:uncharacterized protein (TIGR00369 family)|tara:strand:+ start:707 stop:1144 length:438 start_codon:yes stop_codon:yes gene_type:complete